MNRTPWCWYEHPSPALHQPCPHTISISIAKGKARSYSSSYSPARSCYSCGTQYIDYLRQYSLQFLYWLFCLIFSPTSLSHANRTTSSRQTIDNECATIPTITSCSNQIRRARPVTSPSQQDQNIAASVVIAWPNATITVHGSIIVSDAETTTTS